MQRQKADNCHEKAGRFSPKEQSAGRRKNVCPQQNACQAMRHSVSEASTPSSEEAETLSDDESDTHSVVPAEA